MGHPPGEARRLAAAQWEQATRPPPDPMDRVRREPDPAPGPFAAFMP